MGEGSTTFGLASKLVWPFDRHSDFKALKIIKWSNIIKFIVKKPIF